MSAASPTPGPSLVPQGPHAGQRLMSLNRVFTLIGSAPSARLYLPSHSVSRCHAVIVNSETGLYVRDLASRLGVLVNGRAVREADLADGDLVQIGTFTFQLSHPNPRPRSQSPAAVPEGALEVDGLAEPIRVNDRLTLIGRRESADVSLTENSASSAHAVILTVGDRHIVRDLNSRTGTFVNEAKVYEHVLKSGDAVRVGETTMRYVRLSAAVELTASDAFPALPLPGPEEASGDSAERAGVEDEAVSVDELLETPAEASSTPLGEAPEERFDPPAEVPPVLTDAADVVPDVPGAAEPEAEAGGLVDLAVEAIPEEPAAVEATGEPTPAVASADAPNPAEPEAAIPSPLTYPELALAAVADQLAADAPDVDVASANPDLGQPPERIAAESPDPAAGAEPTPAEARPDPLASVAAAEAEHTPQASSGDPLADAAAPPADETATGTPGALSPSVAERAPAAVVDSTPVALAATELPPAAIPPPEPEPSAASEKVPARIEALSTQNPRGNRAPAPPPVVPTAPPARPAPATAQLTPPATSPNARPAPPAPPKAPPAIPGSPRPSWGSRRVAPPAASPPVPAARPAAALRPPAPPLPPQSASPARPTSATPPATRPPHKPPRHSPPRPVRPRSPFDLVPGIKPEPLEELLADDGHTKPGGNAAPER